MRTQMALSRYPGPGHQRGVLALVAAVVILVAATLVTLYTASPVRTEQQVTANERRSFQALNAAEAGLAFAMSAVSQYNHDDFIEDGSHVEDLCDSVTLEGGGTFIVTQVNGQACADGWPPFSDEEIVLGYRSIPVVVEGRSDDRVAFRSLGQTYFLIDPRNPAVEGDGDNLAPLNFAGPVTTFDAARSNRFEVDGGGGAAISTSDEGNRNFVWENIAQDRRQNYKGGVAGGGFGEPFGDPGSLAAFLTEIQGGNPIATGPQNQGSYSWNEGVYWVSGDMEIKGNQSGEGVLVIEGKLTTYGTPEWEGLIIVLGGEYEVKGGGGADYTGSIFVANMDHQSNSPEFGDVNFEVSGGGNLDFIADADVLKRACNLLPVGARNLWNCDEIEIGGGSEAGVDEPFAPLTGILSGSWIDFQQN